MTSPVSSTSTAGIATSAADDSLTTRLRADASPEAVLALAALHVEESADRSRETRTIQRQARSAQQRSAISQKRRAARFQLGASLVQSAASIGGGIAGAGGNESLGKIIESSGAGIAAGLNVGTSNATHAAETLELQSREASEGAEDSGAHAQRQEQHASKVLQGAGELARLRHEAMMKSIQG